MIRLSSIAARAVQCAVVATMLSAAHNRALGQAAMIYGTDANNSPDGVVLPQPTEKWFTQGNGTSINGTQVPAYWVNKVGGELSSAIQGVCGGALDMAHYNQLNTCLLYITTAITNSPGRLLATQVYTSGSATFSPVAGARTFEVEMIGGGGGGGGAASTDAGHISVGSGGGAGSYLRFMTTTGISGATVTVGAGGTGGAAGAQGNSGGATTIGTLAQCPATGMSGTGYAPTGTISQVGQGQAALPCTTSGQVLVMGSGQPGPNSLLLGNTVMGGQGAPSVFGGGQQNTNQGSGGNSFSAGAGGSGAACPPSCPGYPGGNGGAGLVIIREFS